MPSVAAKNDVVDEMLRQWGRKKPHLDASGLGIVLRIVLLSGILEKRLEGVLAPASVAPWEFDVLAALRRAGGRRGLSPKQLCESARLTSGAMTHRLDRLEARGFVLRRAQREDGRRVHVLLTPRGRALVDRVIGARMEEAAQSVAALPRQERKDLARLLRTLGLALDDA